MDGGVNPADHFPVSAAHAGTYCFDLAISARRGGEENQTSASCLRVPTATKGGKPVTLTHPLAYMVSAKSKHPDLAFKLISAVTSDEANTRHAVGSTHLGVLKSQATYAPYLEDRLLTEVLYMLEFTTFIPNNPNWGVYNSAWFEGMQSVESGDMTAAEAVDFVVERMQAELGDKVIIR